MGSRTGIAWTDATWNPVRGCSRVSDGCRFCYAEVIAARFSDVGRPFHGFANIGARKGEHRWTGRVELVPEKLEEPLRWRKPRRVFVNSMSDLFHERLSNEDIAAVFGVMARCPHLTFQVLTKRPWRMREWFPWAADSPPITALARCVMEAEDRLRVWPDFQPAFRVPWPLPNVWLGVSVEDQATADARIPILLDTPAAVRFVSYEPALGPADFRRWLGGSIDPTLPPAQIAEAWGRVGLAWVIVGGESGPQARPCDVTWARSVRDQCKAAEMAFFMKQRGSLWYDSDRNEGLRGACVVSGLALAYGAFRFVRQRDRAGADPAEWPEDLRVREFPGVARG